MVDLEKIAALVASATPSGEWMVIPRGDDGSKGWWVAGDEDRCAFNDADTSPETRDYLVALHNAAAAMVAELRAARLLVDRLRAIAPHSPEAKYLLAMLSDYDREVQP